VRLGIAHHYGWAVAVTASDDHRVVDRRRIELIGPDLPPAPVHHLGGTHALHATGDAISGELDDAALAALVADVRGSVVRAASNSLDELAAALPGPLVSISVRAWPDDFPTDVAVLRRPPHESRADSVMNCQVLAELGRAREWDVHCYDAKHAEARATAILGERADAVLHGPRARLGAPWAKDHRVALAATVLAGAEDTQAG
jgi:hypothetical protein